MDTAKSSSHVYTPLQQPTSIRLAIIEPSMDPDAPLRFSFHQACLEDLEGRYEAVSYVWGAPILRFPVYNSMDGSHLLITKNLNHALRKLRQRLDPRWLWADAMCIDQKNDREKAIQIPLMVQIFRGATRVLAWLQDSDEALERAMHYIDHVSRRSHGPQLQIEGNADADRMDIDDRVADILMFFNLPYFRRLWILQEVAMSVDITFICGKTRLSWLRMYTVLQSKRYKRLADSSQPNIAGLRAACLTAEEWGRNCLIRREPSTVASRRHIFDLVSASDMYQCTDARDRIFGLYSLANHETAHMDIDYSLDVYATYRNFALACTADGRTFDVLDAAVEHLDMTSSTKWPSWVPDWRRNVTKSSLPKPDFADSYDLREVHTGIVYEDVVELRKKALETSIDYRPLLVHTERIVRMQESAFIFLREIVNLIREADMKFLPNAFTPCATLEFLFLWKWSPEARRSQLGHLIYNLWDGPYKEYDEEVHGHVQSLLDYIAAIAHGYSCFVANIDNIPYVCYGRAEFAEGDILFPMGGFYDTLESQAYFVSRMYVFRPVVRPAKQNPLTRHQTHWTAPQFSIVGEALTFWPTGTHMSPVLRTPFKGLIYLC
jgi:hypothetical protein